MVGDQYIMGPGGPVGINLVAVGYVLDSSEVDDRLYFIRKIKQFTGEKINKMLESLDNGKTGS